MPYLKKKHLEKLSHRDQVAFALFCAKQVYHLLKKNEKFNKKAQACIETVERWFEGRATEEECRRVASVANSAATAAANAAYAIYATYAAAYATYAAAYAVNAASNAADAAATAAVYAADAAAYATTYAAYAAADASAQREQLAEAQWKYYKELLKADSYLIGF